MLMTLDISFLVAAWALGGCSSASGKSMDSTNKMHRIRFLIISLYSPLFVALSRTIVFHLYTNGYTSTYIALYACP